MRLIEYTARLWINCQRVLFRAGAGTFQSAATHVLATGHLLAFNKTKPPCESKVAADWKVRAPAHRNIVSPKPEKTGVVGSYAPRRTLSPVGLALSFVLLLTLFGCSHQPPNQLVVGMELNYPPFETVDQQGHAAGISVELAQELGKALHRELRIENIPFGGLIPALQTAKIDLIISSMTETAERTRAIDFSDPYLHTGLCLLINQSARIESITEADKPNITIAVKQGTTGQIYAREHLKNAHVLVFDKEDACVLEVIQNKAQGFIYDQMSVYKHWQQHQDTTKALLKPFQQEQWAIGLRKNQDELKNQVNGFLKEFKTSGGFDRLGEKYLADQKAAFAKLNIPFYF